ncbi:hypothetical protein [Edaphobacter modestus]|nr:hypothetical protein [Edaphobacter modestus]
MNALLFGFRAGVRDWRLRRDIWCYGRNTGILRFAQNDGGRWGWWRTVVVLMTAIGSGDFGVAALVVAASAGCLALQAKY